MAFPTVSWRHTEVLVAVGTIVPGRIVPVVFAAVMDLKRAMAINLRRERHAKNWSQEELADRARLSTRYLGSIERAAVSSSVTVLGRVHGVVRHFPPVSPWSPGVPELTMPTTPWAPEWI